MATKRKTARSRSTRARAAGKGKAARKKVSAKKPAKRKAAKKKVSARKKVTPKKKVSAKKAPKRKAPGKKVSAKKPAKRKTVKKPARRKASARSSRTARPDMERRAAAVREQLSKAKIGTFDDLVEPSTPEVQVIARQLRSLVQELVPDARETVYLRWRIALYKTATEICAIQPATDRCNFYLTKGAYLHDPQGILEGTGKSIRHVKVRSVVGMAAESIRDLLKQALEITKP